MIIIYTVGSIIVLASVIGAYVFGVNVGIKAMSDQIKKEFENNNSDFSKQMDKVISEAEKAGAAKIRWKEIEKITKEQNSLISSMYNPSSNSLHSRHKNNIAQQIKALEEKKNDILKEFLKDGLDPEVTALDPIDKTVRKMRVSELIKKSEDYLNFDGNSKSSKIKTDSIKPQNKMSHLKLVKEKADVNRSND